MSDTLRYRRDLVLDILKARALKNGDGKRYTYREIAAHLYPDEDANKMGALLCKILKHPEYYPGKEVCERLGIVHKVEQEICAVHGIVHCYDCETEQVKPRRNHRPKRKRTPPVRIGEATEEQLSKIMAMTPAERLEKLLK